MKDRNGQTVSDDDIVLLERYNLGNMYIEEMILGIVEHVGKRIIIRLDTGILTSRKGHEIQKMTKEQVVLWLLENGR